MADIQHSDPHFQALVDEFGMSAVANDAGTIFGLWPDLRLAYFNLGWLQFAAANGGTPKIAAEWRLGRCVLDAIPEPLRPFFVENYRKCLLEERPWEHLYECSSDQLYREFHMTVYPLGDAEGLLVVNSLRREINHTRIAYPPLDELYRNEHGIATQCSHCRRVRRIGAESVWDWVPAWVSAQASGISHGLCEPCLAFHYSSRRADADCFLQSFMTIS